MSTETVVLAAAFTIFAGEVDRAAEKLDAKVEFVYIGQSDIYAAWVKGATAIGINQEELVSSHPLKRTRLKWLAWHEVCHVKLQHKWTAETTAGEITRDHLEVRACMQAGMGYGRFRFYRDLLRSGYAGKWDW